jgi:hypothetical protein
MLILLITTDFHSIEQIHKSGHVANTSIAIHKLTHWASYSLLDIDDLFKYL